ncbi:MAG: SIS domain-containing protein, partial [Clostridia bacterium]
MGNYGEAKELILGEVAHALGMVAEAEVQALVEAIIQAKKVFVIGVGRVLLSLQAFEKRLNHMGICAYFVGEINEPAITPEDMLIVGSGSGESLFPAAIAEKARKLGAKVAYIGSNRASTVARIADVVVRIPVSTKLKLPDELQSEQIMSSLFEQSLYILLDAVTLVIARERDIDVA